MRRSLIGYVGGVSATTPWAAAHLLGPFCLPFVSIVFSYLPNYRKVVRSRFVSM
jgi:hypothetical protein